MKESRLVIWQIECGWQLSLRWSFDANDWVRSMARSNWPRIAVCVKIRDSALLPRLD